MPHNGHPIEKSEGESSSGASSPLPFSGNTQPERLPATVSAPTSSSSSSSSAVRSGESISPLTERSLSDSMLRVSDVEHLKRARADATPSPRPHPRYDHSTSSAALVRLHDDLRKWSSDRPAVSASPVEAISHVRARLVEDMEHLHPKDVDRIIETIACMMRERGSNARFPVGCHESLPSPPPKNYSTQALRDMETKLQQSAQHISLARITWEHPPRGILLMRKHNDREVSAWFKEVLLFLTSTFADIPFYAPADLISEEIHNCESDDYSHALSLLKVWRPMLSCNVQDPPDLDIVLSFGGDGTLLHVASLFQCEMPPVLSFSLGSLGFLTPFEISSFRETLSNVLVDGGNMVTMRMRLRCEIVPKDKDVVMELGDRRDSIAEDEEASTPTKELPKVFHVMNELVVDRGPSSFISNMDVYVDGSLVTCVQGDGLIVATPTGSTAYSVAAGGSVVHPHVPCFLLTPICPHSLSFRPIIIPSSVTLKITVPEDARNPAWCSFDGRNSQQLKQGDSVIITISPFPVPTINKAGQTPDWFTSLSSGLGWNVGRQRQKAFTSPVDTNY